MAILIFLYLIICKIKTIETTYLLNFNRKKNLYLLWNIPLLVWLLCWTSVPVSGEGRLCQSGRLEWPHPLPSVSFCPVQLSGVSFQDHWLYQFWIHFPNSGEMCPVLSTAQRSASWEGRPGGWVEEMGGGRRLVGPDRRRRVSGKVPRKQKEGAKKGFGEMAKKGTLHF